VEIYGTTARMTHRIDSLFRLLSTEPRDYGSHVYVHEDVEALRHLFRVTGGLDSMVIGETEITGQVKKAYDIAQDARLTGRVLNRVFQKTFQAAKEIRARTSIGRGATSVGSVAVELAEKIFRHDLSKQTVIIIGAGQMGEACVRHLAKKGAQSILVSNRSFDRAVELANEFGGQAVQFESCLAAMADADIVVASTGCPKTLLHRVDVEALMKKRRNRPLFLIDISVRVMLTPTCNRSTACTCTTSTTSKRSCAKTCARVNRNCRCSQIVETRAMALMTKLNLEKERLYDVGVQSQPRWVSHGAAVLGS